jgi:hypothetical protein
MITNFKSLPLEGLYENYPRLREILSNHPHHDFPHWLIIHTFYAGVNGENRDLLDLLIDRSFTEGVDKAWNLLETIHKDELSKDSEELDEKSLVELESINKFMQSKKVVELLGNNKLQPKDIIHIVKSYAKHLQLPNYWERNEPSSNNKSFKKIPTGNQRRRCMKQKSYHVCSRRIGKIKYG